MDPRKQAIMAALDKFAEQRPGLDFGNYGDVSAYRAESRSITRDLHHYRELARYVERHDSITADMLLAATRAYSGRLTLNDCRATYDDGSVYYVFSVSYCTGQYFPTEYRRAACAVLASALWYWTREHAMPEPIMLGEDRLYPTTERARRTGDWRKSVSAGDWLRGHFRQEFGRHIASRWFD